MKFLSIFPVLFLFSAGFCAAQCENVITCGDDHCQCTEWSPWAHESKTFPYPPKPECLVDVEYCYRQCLNNPRCVEYFILGVGTIDCAGCDELFNELNDPDPWVRARRTRDMITNVFREIVNIKWDDFLQNLPQSEWPDCNDPNEIRQKFRAWQASCTAYCWTQDPIGYDEDIDVLFTTQPCSEEFCCYHDIYKCYNFTTGETETMEDVGSDYTGDCTILIPDLGSCPPGQNVQISDCIEPCTLQQ